jgi:hypothetical protein
MYVVAAVAAVKEVFASKTFFDSRNVSLGPSSRASMNSDAPIGQASQNADALIGRDNGGL